MCLSGSWTRLFTCPLLCNDTCPWWSRQCSSRTRMLTCPLFQRHVPVAFQTVQFSPSSGGTRGVSTGAVLGQVVLARRCSVWCRWPDSAENSWRLHRFSSWTRLHARRFGVWCRWPDSGENMDGCLCCLVGMVFLFGLAMLLKVLITWLKLRLVVSLLG